MKGKTVDTVPGGSNQVVVPHTELFDDIRQHLGGVVPCYGERIGCHMDDHTDCSEGCVLLRVYEAGYKAAVKDKT